jgi:hypothetical protein
MDARHVLGGRVRHPARAPTPARARDAAARRLPDEAEPALPADLDDMRKIWPQITDQFASAADVITKFQAAFPFEPDDEHLADFVVNELAKGGFTLSPT